MGNPEPNPADALVESRVPERRCRRKLAEMETLATPASLLLLLSAPAFGSFLTVLVERLPRGESVVRIFLTSRGSGFEGARAGDEYPRGRRAAKHLVSPFCRGSPRDPFRVRTADPRHVPPLR